MVNIQPISIWKDGVEYSATILDAIIINDDMETSCQFYYQLKDENQSLASGNVGMSGEDYSNWDDSNAQAYQFIASKLNLTIIS